MKKNFKKIYRYIKYIYNGIPIQGSCLIVAFLFRKIRLVNIVLKTSVFTAKVYIGI